MMSIEDAAIQLIRSLEAKRLRVSLVPAPDPRHSGHKVRVVEEQNSAWYRDLCQDYISSRRIHPSCKKTKTAIKRAHTLRALRKISQGHRGGLYIERLMPIVSRLAKGELDLWDDWAT